MFSDVRGIFVPKLSPLTAKTRVESVCELNRTGTGESGFGSVSAKTAMQNKQINRKINDNFENDLFISFTCKILFEIAKKQLLWKGLQ